jgi:hypothetical protein
MPAYPHQISWRRRRQVDLLLGRQARVLSQPYADKPPLPAHRLTWLMDLVSAPFQQLYFLVEADHDGVAAKGAVATQKLFS